MKSIILVAIVFLGCVAFNEALQCYSHDPCSTNCPQLNTVIRTCEIGNDRCYKAAFPGGVSRGCARDRCDVQFNANSVMASVCCVGDLCNSAMTPKITITTLLMVIIAFFFARI